MLPNRHQARKKLVEAEQVQERAVAIAENVYGTDHPQVSVSSFLAFPIFSGVCEKLPVHVLIYAVSYTHLTLPTICSV